MSAGAAPFPPPAAGFGAALRSAAALASAAFFAAARLLLDAIFAASAWSKPAGVPAVAWPSWPAALGTACSFIVAWSAPARSTGRVCRSAAASSGESSDVTTPITAVAPTSVAPIVAAIALGLRPNEPVSETPPRIRPAGGTSGPSPMPAGTSRVTTVSWPNGPGSASWSLSATRRLARLGRSKPASEYRARRSAAEMPSPSVRWRARVVTSGVTTVMRVPRRNGTARIHRGSARAPHPPRTPRGAGGSVGGRGADGRPGAPIDVSSTSTSDRNRSVTHSLGRPAGDETNGV